MTDTIDDTWGTGAIPSTPPRSTPTGFPGAFFPLGYPLVDNPDLIDIVAGAPPVDTPT